MTIQIAHLDALGFAPGGARLAPMLEVDHMRVLLLSLEEGQAVDPCQMSLTVLYLVLEGQGRLQVGAESAELQVGTLAVVPQGAVRSIQSETRMRVLVVQAP
jgi:quercetin dioxygenase-like cupin family protein